MTLAFRAYDASRCDYPRPRIPVTPVLEFAHLSGLAAKSEQASSFASPNRVMFARGRYALFHALRALGLGPEHSVLLPAYHCRTMVDPVVRLGAAACFYPLATNLAPDLVRLQTVVDLASRPVKALLLPHYFGYAQDVEPVAAFCDKRGILLIEDCCHAYFGSARGRALGSTGDCAIASPSKFFPCEDGGVLILRKAQLPAQPGRRSIADELRSAYRVAEKAWSGLARRADTAEFKDLSESFAAIRRRYPRWKAEVTTGPALSHQYLLEMEPLGALSLSQMLMRSNNAALICERRRRNYAALLNGVRSLQGCRPLYPDLPEGTVPYMFPLLIDQPESRFHWLKHLRVPMYRWDELAISDCAVSSHYRLHLVHLPCHQAMHDHDIAWLLHALSLVITAKVEPDWCQATVGAKSDRDSRQ